MTRQKICYRSQSRFRYRKHILKTSVSLIQVGQRRKPHILDINLSKKMDADIRAAMSCLAVESNVWLFPWSIYRFRNEHDCLVLIIANHVEDIAIVPKLFYQSSVKHLPKVPFLRRHIRWRYPLSFRQAHVYCIYFKWKSHMFHFLKPYLLEITRTIV